MPRNPINDKLMTHQFHLIDVDWSMGVPPWVLLPSAGFASITAPEITIETEEIQEGTDPYVHHVLKKASTNTITLQRGVNAFNSDFWRWTVSCLHGKRGDDTNIFQFFSGIATLSQPNPPAKRRDLLLIHFTRMSPGGLIDSVKQAGAEKAVGAMVKGGLLTATGGAFAAAEQVIDSATGGLVDLGENLVPGKAFILFECLPTRYKPASDFDANASEISLEEIDLNYHRFEELSLSA